MSRKKSKQQRAANGSVSVEIRGKSLGLRLPERHFGDRRYFALLLPDSPECRAIAELKAKELELELALGKFEGNLEKFRPPIAPQLPAQPKISLSLADLWEEYANFRRAHISPSTWKNGYLVISSHCQRCPIQNLSEAIAIADWAISTLSSDTASRFLMQVNAACKWALRRGKIASNPFEEIRKEFKPKKKLVLNRKFFRKMSNRQLLRLLRKKRQNLRRW